MKKLLISEKLLKSDIQPDSKELVLLHGAIFRSNHLYKSKGRDSQRHCAHDAQTSCYSHGVEMPMLPSRETASYQWVLSRFQPSFSISGGVHLFCFTKAARTKKKHKNRWHHSSRLFCGSAPLFFGHRYTNRVSLLGTSLGQHMCITIRGGAKYIKHRQTGSSLLHRAI